MRARLVECPPGEQNSDSCHASPTSGTQMASRNLPAVTSSTIWVRRPPSPSAVSAQASHPQLGKASMRQRPIRTRSPGNAVNATAIDAALVSRGTSLTLGRARSTLSNPLSRPYPSTCSTSKVVSKWPINSTMRVCRGRKRSGFVTREYASGSGTAEGQGIGTKRPSLLPSTCPWRVTNCAYK
jgi:hypothetical protein